MGLTGERTFARRVRPQLCVARALRRRQVLAPWSPGRSWPEGPGQRVGEGHPGRGARGAAGPSGHGGSPSAARRCPRAGKVPARPHQMKSVQWLQKVGCLKKRAVNLWFFTSCTFFCRRAPLRAKRTVLSSPSAGGVPAAGSAILRAGRGSPRGATGARGAGCGREARGRRPLLPSRDASLSGSGGRALGAAAVTRQLLRSASCSRHHWSQLQGVGAEPRAGTPPRLHCAQAPPLSLLYILASAAAGLTGKLAQLQLCRAGTATCSLQIPTSPLIRPQAWVA